MKAIIIFIAFLILAISADCFADTIIGVGMDLSRDADKEKLAGSFGITAPSLTDSFLGGRLYHNAYTDIGFGGIKIIYGQILSYGISDKIKFGLIGAVGSDIQDDGRGDDLIGYVVGLPGLIIYYGNFWLSGGYKFDLGTSTRYVDDFVFRAGIQF